MNDESPHFTTRSASRGPVLGAMFLMATSAIGPGFITQTTQFTAQLGAAFAFAIVASILVDIALQLNVWRVIGVSGLRAQELGERLLPGVGRVLAFLVVLGGLVFNVGNVAGCGLGLNAMLGRCAAVGRRGIGADRGRHLPRAAGGRGDGPAGRGAGFPDDRADRLRGLGVGASGGAALRNAVLPERVDFLAITTLVGGTVGGYITYAGAHRLVDAGVRGAEHAREISRASVTGVLVTGAMRVLCFWRCWVSSRLA